MKFLTVTLTLCIFFSVVFIGVYSVADATQPTSPQSDDSSVLEEKLKEEHEALVAELAEEHKKELEDF